MKIQLAQMDEWLIHRTEQRALTGLKRFLVEFLFFGLKNARACLFAGLFFLSIMAVPRAGYSWPA